MKRIATGWWLGLACLVLAAACGDNAENTADVSPTPVATNTKAAGPELLVAFAPNPLQPGDRPDTIRLVNLATGDKRDLGDAAAYTHLSFSPDGGLLAAAATQGTGSAVRLYDVDTGTRIGHELVLTDLAGVRWSPNGAFLAAISSESVTFVSRGGEAIVREAVGVPPGSNPLRWTWSSDSTVFALVTADGLELMPPDPRGGLTLPLAEFPDPEATWAVRTGAEPREIGLVNLAPVPGLPEAREEWPLVVEQGELTAGEPRLVSIYDWGTLPTPSFDRATALRFPAIRKTCDPCRTADGGSSMLLFWLIQDGPTPGPNVEQWPPGTGTYLALESAVDSAVAVDLGIAPTGPIDVDRWRPVYDAVRVN